MSLENGFLISFLLLHPKMHKYIHYTFSPIWQACLLKPRWRDLSFFLALQIYTFLKKKCLSFHLIFFYNTTQLILFALFIFKRNLLFPPTIKVMGRNQYSLPVFFLNGIFFVDMYACYRFYHCTFTTTSLTPALVIPSRRRRWRERIKVYGLYFFHPHSLFIPQQNTGPSTKYTENHSRDEPHRSSETLSLNVDYIYSFFSLSSFLYPSRYRWVFFPLLFTEYYYSGETQLGLTWKPLVSRILGGCRDRSLATSDRQLWRDLPFAMVFFFEAASTWNYAAFFFFFLDECKHGV